MLRVTIRDESGAVSIIVALFVTVLFAFTALSVDIARLYEERRALVSSSDLSALSGAQLLWKTEADAEAAGEIYVTLNPTINHSGAYDETGGDLVDADRISDGSPGCPLTVNGATSNFDCVRSTVKAPAFHFLFGSILGFRDRPVTSSSTAIMGKGSISGRQVFPWLLRDCPNAAQYPDETGLSVGQCPYTFTDDFNGPKTTFDEALPNFVGAVMPHTNSGCPVQAGFRSGVNSGNATYSSVMEGAAGFEPCLIAPGQRLETRGGALGGTTANALTARGANTTSCMNETSFNNTFTREGDGDGFVAISDHSNPCLILVSFVVGATDNATNRSDTAQTVAAAQKTVAGGRFADLANNQFVVVRRSAYYYITSYSGNKPQGVYLRAINSNATLSGPLDKCPTPVAITQCAHHGIFVVKLSG